MTKQINQIRVFISCPDDVNPEKRRVREICARISNALLTKRNIEIKPIDWSIYRGTDGIDTKFCDGEACELQQK